MPIAIASDSTEAGVALEAWPRPFLHALDWLAPMQESRNVDLGTFILESELPVLVDGLAASSSRPSAQADSSIAAASFAPPHGHPQRLPESLDDGELPR